MIIEKIKLNNFRSYRDLDLKFNSNLNILVGENNTGKTNLFIVFKKLIAVLENKNKVQEGLISQIFHETDWYNMDSDRELEFSITLKLNKDEVAAILHEIDQEQIIEKVDFVPNIQYELDEYYDAYPEPPSEADEWRRTNKLKRQRQRSMFLKNNKPALDFGLVTRKYDKIIVHFFIPKAYFKNYQFFRTNLRKFLEEKKLYSDLIQKPYEISIKPNSNSSLFKRIIIPKVLLFLTEKIKVFTDLRRRPIGTESGITNFDCLDGVLLANVLFQLKNSSIIEEQKQYEEIQTVFSQFFQGIELDINKTRDKNVLTIQIFNKARTLAVDLERMGTGVLEILILITNIIRSKGKIFILEEPELHLHPSIQKKLVRFLIENCKNNQIFVITHSPYFISPSTIKYLLKVSKMNDKTKISKFDIDILIQNRIDRGITNVTAESTMARLTRLLANSTIEGLFGKSVVLCEGETEFLSLNLWADILNLNFEERDIIIVPSQGKFSMIDLAEFFRMFGVPVFLIFDSDNDKHSSTKRAEDNQENNKWLLKFAGEERDKSDMTTPNTEVGHNFCIFDPDYERVLIREDPKYEELKRKVCEEYSLETDRNRQKGIKAYYIALKYKGEKKEPPKIIKDLITNIINLRE